MKKDLNIVMNGETLVLGSGRIGYVHVYEEGEELRQPQFKVGTYENGTFIPQAH